MPISCTPEMLAVDLRTYGEDDLAERVLSAEPGMLERIFGRADHYVYSDEYASPSGGSMLLSKALALATIDVIEGQPRPLRWKRRRLKGISPGH